MMAANSEPSTHGSCADNQPPPSYTSVMDTPPTYVANDTHCSMVETSPPPPYEEEMNNPSYISALSPPPSYEDTVGSTEV